MGIQNVTTACFYRALPSVLLLLSTSACALNSTTTTRKPIAVAMPPAVSVKNYTTTQALFRSAVENGRVASITGAFAAGDEVPSYISAGRSTEAPDSALAGPDTLWRVYSMTKPVTGIATMILVQEGKLKLDQPVSDFFPGFKSMRVLVDPEHSMETRPATQQITIRHLLTHTSGLSYGFVPTTPVDKEFLRLGLMPYAFDPASDAAARKIRPPTLQLFAERLATLPLLQEPGTKWSYGIGFDLLGAVIEKASGMPFDQFLHARIFAPLKMNSTFFTVPKSEVGRLATSFAHQGSGRTVLDSAANSMFLQPPTFPYGGAGLVSSARDFDRFLHMLQNEGELDGVRILTPETARLAMSNLLPSTVSYRISEADTALDATGRASGPVTFAAGFGAGGRVFLTDIPGKATAGTFGWGGAAGTLAAVNPVRKYRMTLMVNEIRPVNAPHDLELGAAVLKDLGL